MRKGGGLCGSVLEDVLWMKLETFYVIDLVGS